MHKRASGRDKSNKRQVVRLLSCINAVRERQGRVVVAFLDFENYFNVVSLPALFMILREMGLSEYDVEALECYYSRAHMQVVPHNLTLFATSHRVRVMISRVRRNSRNQATKW